MTPHQERVLLCLKQGFIKISFGQCRLFTKGRTDKPIRSDTVDAVIDNNDVRILRVRTPKKGIPSNVLVLRGNEQVLDLKFVVIEDITHIYKPESTCQTKISAC